MVQDTAMAASELPAPPAAPRRPRISAEDLAQLLGSWARGKRPLYRLLAEAIEDCVARGDLAPGTFLPAERTLAAALAVARGTVVSAFELCREEGTLDRRHGSGTWVARGPVVPVTPEEPGIALRAGRLSARLLDDREFPGIDLSTAVHAELSGIPEGAFDLRPAELSKLGTHGYHPLGIPALREAVAERFSRDGVPTTADQVMITNGAQHALALISRLLLRPGDVVAIENPTFPGAIDAYARSLATFAPLPVDGAGVPPDVAARALEAVTATLVHVTPSCHNPTGSVMPPARRAQLANIIEDAGAWLVEDETVAPTCFAGDPPLPVASHTLSDRVITVGSLSKVAWSGLRVGWLRASRELVLRFGRLRAASDLGLSVPSQVIACRVFEDYPAVVSARREILAARAGALCDLLTDLIPDWSYQRPSGGLSLWVGLGGHDGDAFSRTAADHGVAVLPGSTASVSDDHRDHVRITLSATPAVLEVATRRLARAWHSYAPAAEGPGINTTLSSDPPAVTPVC